VRVDHGDGGDEPTRSAETPAPRGPEMSDAPTGREGDAGQADASVRVERSLTYQAGVEAVNRRYAIDQGYERIREIEDKIVTPAMRRIEAEDPERHLAGLDNRLKGKERLTEKINEAVDERGRSVHEALGMVKDAMRYTFCYPDDRYAQGVYADCERLENMGFGRVDRINSWDAEEYKGINSRWRVPGGGHLFEVQFHTQASLDAKEETHWAYERIRSLPDDDAEVAELHAYQRAVTSKVSIPPGAVDIPDYKYR
jgi:hypothetical protein